MPKLFKSIASAFGGDKGKITYRYSRGVGPHPAPRSPR
jgi:hypothetical protein